MTGESNKNNTGEDINLRLRRKVATDESTIGNLEETIAEQGRALIANTTIVTRIGKKNLRKNE